MPHRRTTTTEAMDRILRWAVRSQGQWRSVSTELSPDRHRVWSPYLRREVEAAVQSLKKGKSAAVDNIPAELAQAGGENVITALTTICNNFRQTGEWPTPCTQSLVITLSKKGNLQQCQNYQTISLISHPSKVMLKIVLKETQTAVVWSCLPFIGSGENRLAKHSERGKKIRQTEKEVGRQHQGMDRPGVRQVPEGSGKQWKNGENWLRNHLWCPNEPRGNSIDDDDDDDDDDDMHNIQGFWNQKDTNGSSGEALSMMTWSWRCPWVCSVIKACSRDCGSTILVCSCFTKPHVLSLGNKGPWDICLALKTEGKHSYYRLLSLEKWRPRTAWNKDACWPQSSSTSFSHLLDYR